MNTHVYGRAKRRVVKLLSDHEARIVLSFRSTPLDGSVLPPDAHGATTIEHDVPVPVSVQLWAVGEDAFDAVTRAEIEAAAAAADGDERCVLRWDAEMVQEVATRKSADSGGGEVVEYRCTLDMPFPSDAPFSSHLPGRLAGAKSASIAIVRKQSELPLEDRSRRGARKSRDEPGLPLGE